jgi:predicted transcriptional regulator
VTDTRDRVDEFVRSNPGVHFSAVVDALALGRGQAQYHLRRLRESGRVAAEAVHGRTHYYPPESDPADRVALAVLRRETARDLLVVLSAREPCSPATLADDLGVARSTVEHHLDRLLEQGLVTKRVEDGTATLRVADRERVARLLDAVAPSAPERMVDRFTALVDDLLSGGR